MNILVTGCAGYIGSVLCPLLLNYNHTVIGVDNFRYKNQASILGIIDHPNFSVYNLDVEQLNLPSSRWLIRSADVIIPLAAMVGAPLCEYNPVIAKAVNYTSIRDLMPLLSKQQLVIFPNTNSGYGSNDETECNENSPLVPISIYGKTKCEAEKCVLDRSGEDTVFRLATVGGTSPRMRFDLLINDFIGKAYYTHEIVMFEPNFKRNFVGIRDVARAFLAAIEGHIPGIYNLGHPEGNLTKLQLAIKIKEYCAVTIKEGAGKDPDQRNYTVNNNKILSTGFKFTQSIPQIIRDTMNFCEIGNEYLTHIMRNLQ